MEKTSPESGEAIGAGCFGQVGCIHRKHAVSMPSLTPLVKSLELDCSTRYRHRVVPDDDGGHPGGGRHAVGLAGGGGRVGAGVGDLRAFDRAGDGLQQPECGGPVPGAVAALHELV